MFNKCSWGGTCFIFQFNSLFTDNLGLAEQCTKGGGPLNLWDNAPVFKDESADDCCTRSFGSASLPPSPERSKKRHGVCVL